MEYIEVVDSIIELRLLRIGLAHDITIDNIYFEDSETSLRPFHIEEIEANNDNGFFTEAMHYDENYLLMYNPLLQMTNITVINSAFSSNFMVV